MLKSTLSGRLAVAASQISEISIAVQNLSERLLTTSGVKAGLCPGTSPLLCRHRLDSESYERQTRDRDLP